MKFREALKQTAAQKPTTGPKTKGAPKPNMIPPPLQEASILWRLAFVWAMQIHQPSACSLGGTSPQEGESLLCSKRPLISPARRIHISTIGPSAMTEVEVAAAVVIPGRLLLLRPRRALRDRGQKHTYRLSSVCFCIPKGSRCTTHLCSASLMSTARNVVSC